MRRSEQCVEIAAAKDRGLRYTDSNRFLLGTDVELSADPLPDQVLIDVEDAGVLAELGPEEVDEIPLPEGRGEHRRKKEGVAGLDACTDIVHSVDNSCLPWRVMSSLANSSLGQGKWRWPSRLRE